MTSGRTAKQRELIRALLRAPPMSIYALAQAVGRPYRRVFDQVRAFAAEGLVTLEPATRNNRRLMMVVPTDLYYQRLQRLDDLHAAGMEIGARRHGPSSSP